MKVLNIRIFAVYIFILVSVSAFSQKLPANSKTVTVYIFLSETCPICQSYTLTLKELYNKYKSQNIQFIGVFPNYYTEESSIAEFKRKFSVPFELITDKKETLTKRFNATITPEVFVVNATNNIIYSGRIDDSFYAVGKRRTVITTSELSDVLSEITSKHPVKTSKTQAVGCIINSSK